MKYGSVLLIALLLIGCGKHKIDDNKKGKGYEQKSEISQQEINIAVKQAEDNNPAGLLKLYRIANNDIEYGVEWSDEANLQLTYLLYLKTELWVMTFAQMDLNEFKFTPLDMPNEYLPNKISQVEYNSEMIKRLKSIKDKKEEMMVNYLLKSFEK